jgi:hypothetical protein
MDTRDAGDERNFKAQWNSVHLLHGILDEAGIPVREERITAPAAACRAGAAVPGGKAVHPPAGAFCGGCRRAGASGLGQSFAEAMAVCAWLWREHDRGVAWTEMAVALTDAASYGPVVSIALRAGGVPFYLGTKLPAHRHGLVRMHVAALRAVPRAGGRRTCWR